MTVYFVDDGGNGSDGLSWETAYTSIKALDAAVALASTDIVYFGADSQCQATNSAALTIVGPAANPPVRFISSTVGTGTTVAYAAGTGNQIDTTEGAYDIIFDGAFALFGMKLNTGRDVITKTDSNESFSFSDGTILLSADGQILLATITSYYAKERIVNSTIDLTNDAANSESPVIENTYLACIELQEVTIANGGNRTLEVLYPRIAGSRWEVSGCDFSSLTGASVIFPEGGLVGGVFNLQHCLLPAGVPVTDLAVGASSCLEILVTNCGTADAPTYCYLAAATGLCAGTPDVYRTGGAEIGAIPYAWYVSATPSNINVGFPFYTPWIYDEVAAGEKTFDLFVVNDYADLTAAEIWLEVEIKSTSGEPQWVLLTDRVVVGAVVQTDDTTSTWNGTGPSFTYKQKLSVTGTVGQAGQYRARVAIGLASTADTDYLYVDPVLTVT